jgi:uncharacterized PurR-regulated membrane protein YhhQ (DUF165 family)
MLDILTEATLEIPLIQIILLMSISTVSLLFGKVKLALMANYIFILYWAYFFNRDLLLEMGGPDNFQYIVVFYFLFGIVIILVAAFSFLFQRNHD